MGYNGEGNLGLGTTQDYQKPQQVGTDNTWIDVSVGGSNWLLGIKKNGTLWAWGNNWIGQLGIGNDTNQNTPQQVGTDTTWVMGFGLC